MLRIRRRPKEIEHISQIPKNEEIAMKAYCSDKRFVFQRGYVVDTFEIRPCKHKPSDVLFIIKMHRVGFPLEIIDIMPHKRGGCWV